MVREMDSEEKIEFLNGIKQDLEDLDYLNLTNIGFYLIHQNIFDIETNLLSGYGYEQLLRYVANLILENELSVFIQGSFIKVCLESGIPKLISKNIISFLNGDEPQKLFYTEGNLNIMDKSDTTHYKGFFCQIPKHFIFDDIHLSKYELDNLFNQQPQADNSELVQQLQATIASQAEQIAELQKQIEQHVSKHTQSDTPLDNEPINNIELNNIKKSVIATHNNLLAKAIKSLDYRNLLNKEDIAKFITPYMQEMAISLTTGNTAKATALYTKIDTIKENHLKGIEFKQGSPTKQDKERQTIELLFTRT